ncbi:reverse transcriptase [Tanacetum coccineum]|uniref:Reverse transcriptase n=1 Tax=Tanacetum coccineum TaxID=301880 RepID=A0ABQ5H413_9ASTR
MAPTTRAAMVIGGSSGRSSDDQGVISDVMKPTVLDDPMAELKNVKYESNAKAYQDAFDNLLSRVEISEENAVSFYLGGLPQEIEMGVRMFKPKTLAEEKGNEGELECLEEEEIKEIIRSPQISLNDLNGVLGYKIIRIRGTVGKYIIHILVDPGLTHNFLDTEMAKKLGCSIKSTCPLAVIVGDGFNMWLSTLGDIKFNFKELKMEFVYKERKMALRGTPKSNMEWLSSKEHSKMVRQGNHAELSSMQLCVYPKPAIQLWNTGGLREEMPHELTKVVEKFEDVFVVLKELPPNRLHDHKIPLMNQAKPVNIRPYRHPPTQKDSIENMVQKLLDYKLNKNTVKDKFSIPIIVIEELIDELYMDKMFSKLDLSKSLSKHVEYLELALSTMRTHQLYAQLSKCVFGTTHVEYLRYVILAEGVSTDLTKITAMKDWPVPTNVKQLRGFLSLTGYYGRFIIGYAIVSKPLSQLLKNNEFKWNAEAQEAFTNLKQAMTSNLVLALPNFAKEFVIKTDDLGVGI